MQNRFKAKKVNLFEIMNFTDAIIVSAKIETTPVIEKAFSSDLMSDVLTLDDHNILLISGLANVQLIRTAEMADIKYILLARGKKATPEMIKLANENEIVLLETPFSIFKASGILYSNGLKALY